MDRKEKVLQAWKDVLYDKELDFFERALNHKTHTSKNDFENHNDLISKWNKSWSLNLPEDIIYKSFYEVRGELLNINPLKHEKFINYYLDLMQQRAGKTYFKMDKYAKCRKLWLVLNKD